MTALFSPLRRWGEPGTISFREGGKCLAAELVSSPEPNLDRFWGARKMGMIYTLFIVGGAHTFPQVWDARVFIHQVQAGQWKASIAGHRILKLRYQLLITIIRGGLMGALAKHWKPKHPHRPTHTHTHYGLRIMEGACLLNAHRKWWDI